MITNLNKIPDIIIVDDHLIFRQGMISICCSERIANVVGSASNGNEFLELITLVKPDLVLMDIDMPGMNGIVTSQKALKFMPNLKIIAFTMYEDEDCCMKMIDLGVKGYLLKSNGLNDFEKAIKKVMNGEYYFPEKMLKGIIIRSTKNSSLKPFEKRDLTESELQVLQQICLSLSTEKVFKSELNKKKSNNY